MRSTRVAVLLLTLFLHAAAFAQWTFISSPAIPSGETENGVSYDTTFVLRNNGQTFPVGSILSVNDIYILNIVAGGFVPYGYMFEVLNAATMKNDPAFEAENAATPGIVPAPSEVGIAGGGATITARLRMTGLRDMYGTCAQQEPNNTSWRLCKGYPGTTQSYLVRWSIFDIGCSLAMSNTYSDERCLVARATAPLTSPVTWVDGNTAPLNGTVATSANAPGFATVPSPLAAGVAPPNVSTSCATGRAAKNMTYMLQMMGAATLNSGYCN
jgi:hypothetical protein